MFVLNRSGDAILQMPLYEGNVIVVPDGVKSLKRDFFFNMHADTHYYLPESLYRLPVNEFRYADLINEKPVYECTIHCPPGSAAEEYARMFDIPYDNDMEVKEQEEEQ